MLFKAIPLYKVDTLFRHSLLVHRRTVFFLILIIYAGSSHEMDTLLCPVDLRIKEVQLCVAMCGITKFDSFKLKENV